MGETAVAPAHDLKAGSHVLYVDTHQKLTYNALVVVVFGDTERTPRPELTVAIVRPGNHGIATRPFISHRDRAKVTDTGYWCWPSEQESQ